MNRLKFSSCVAQEGTLLVGKYFDAAQMSGSKFRRFFMGATALIVAPIKKARRTGLF